MENVLHAVPLSFVHLHNVDLYCHPQGLLGDPGDVGQDGVFGLEVNILLINTYKEWYV